MQLLNTSESIFGRRVPVSAMLAFPFIASTFGREKTQQE